MVEPRKTLRQIPRAIWILGFVSLFTDISSEMIHSILPLFMVTSLGMSALAVGLIEGVAEALALIVKVFSGALSDYFRNRKGLTLFGYLISTLTKPLFALASGAGLILAARLIDRLGKGIRGAPRDALIADLAPSDLRGASFGLRQSLDTVGAFVGPLLATTLMLLWQNDFRRVFWVAVIPGVLSIFLLLIGIKEPADTEVQRRRNPLGKQNLARLDRHYWWVVTLGAIFTLARFSEAFLVLRAQQVGVPMGLVPLIVVTMNMVYAASAYPFGKLADRISHTRILGLGIAVLICSDIFLATASHWGQLLLGVSLWGIHLGLTQGLLSKMIADVSPVDLRGTAYGFYNLISGFSMLIASSLAGLLWERFGAPTTFFSGISFCVITLIVMWYRPRGNSPRS